MDMQEFFERVAVTNSVEFRQTSIEGNMVKMKLEVELTPEEANDIFVKLREVNENAGRKVFAPDGVYRGLRTAGDRDYVRLGDGTEVDYCHSCEEFGHTMDEC